MLTWVEGSVLPALYKLVNISYSHHFLAAGGQACDLGLASQMLRPNLSEQPKAQGWIRFFHRDGIAAEA